jgi:hypothetical protein
MWKKGGVSLSSSSLSSVSFTNTLMIAAIVLPLLLSSQGLEFSGFFAFWHC